MQGVSLLLSVCTNRVMSGGTMNVCIKWLIFTEGRRIITSLQIIRDHGCMYVHSTLLIQLSQLSGNGEDAASGEEFCQDGR